MEEKGLGGGEGDKAEGAWLEGLELSDQLGTHEADADNGNTERFRCGCNAQCRCHGCCCSSRGENERRLYADELRRRKAASDESQYVGSLELVIVSRGALDSGRIVMHFGHYRLYRYMRSVN